jgi:hypothetical protein
VSGSVNQVFLERTELRWWSLSDLQHPAGQSDIRAHFLDLLPDIADQVKQLALL